MTSRIMDRGISRIIVNPPMASNLIDSVFCIGSPGGQFGNGPEGVRADSAGRRGHRAPRFEDNNLLEDLLIERRSGNVQAVQDFGRKLQERFPESSEVLLFEKGRFDD